MNEIFNYILYVNKYLEGNVSTIRQKSRMWGRHSLKLTGRKFKSKIRMYYFTEGVVKAWNQLSEITGSVISNGI